MEAFLKSDEAPLPRTLAYALIRMHNYSILKDDILLRDYSIIFLIASHATSLVFSFAEIVLYASLIDFAVTTRDFLFIYGVC